MPRPSWVDEISLAFKRRKRNVIALTGNVRDVFAAADGEFVPIEHLLYQELKKGFTMVKYNSASGIVFYQDEDKAELARLLDAFDGISSKDKRTGGLDEVLKICGESSLAALTALRKFSEVITTRRKGPGEGQPLPLCIIMQFSGALFPPGEFDRLSEMDRQRLVFLLNWIDDPLWNQGSNLLILVNETRAELNGRIFSHPGTQQVKIELPSESDRRLLVEKRGTDVKFEPGPDALIGDAAGLKLTQFEDLLAIARGTQTPLNRISVLQEVNVVLNQALEGIVKVVDSTHGRDGISGSDEAKKIMEQLYLDCEDPETASAGILVAGPNGGGKTHFVMGMAKDSGRINIELKGLRGSYFGETDKYQEMLNSWIRVFGRIQITVDEAHTAFGSVHSKDTHETEKRLAGNIIKMMSDPALLGKVVWVLMTSRPDELDPDIKSRCTEQFAIFDPEGEERQAIVASMFERKKISISAEELPQLMERTKDFSMRDYAGLIRKTRARKTSVLEVLDKWTASRSIIAQRRFQTLVAMKHCSYPELIPASLKKLSEADRESAEQLLRIQLHL